MLCISVECSIYYCIMIFIGNYVIQVKLEGEIIIPLQDRKPPLKNTLIKAL